MKLPEKIRVGAHDLKIVVGYNSEKYGEYIEQDDMIFIANNGVPTTKKIDTVLHEILHVLYGAGHLQEGTDVDADMLTEERIVTVLASGLTQVFRDNPDLVDVLGELNKNNNELSRTQPTA